MSGEPKGLSPFFAELLANQTVHRSQSHYHTSGPLHISANAPMSSLLGFKDYTNDHAIYKEKIKAKVLEFLFPEHQETPELTGDQFNGNNSMCQYTIRVAKAKDMSGQERAFKDISVEVDIKQDPELKSLQIRHSSM